MIIKYLTELLYDNECVIVADFGAFITQRHSAVIDYTNNRFYPPYKEIIFNNKLVTDDGLLVNFICQKENITNDEAVDKIQKFVNQSMAILEVNSNVEFENFGKITVDFKGDYVFTLDKNINLLSDSYGMDQFDCNAIYRTETYHDLKEKIAVEQKQKNTEYSVAIENTEKNSEPIRRPSLFKSFAYATLAFLLIFMINWTTDKSESNLASWNPFLYSSPNEFFINLLDNRNVSVEIEEDKLVENVEIEKVTTIEVETVEPTEIVEEEITAVAEEIEIIATVEEETIETAEDIEVESVEFSEEEYTMPLVVAPYYIVGGSFKTEDSAEKCLNGIKRQGFERASMLEKNAQGYIRVYYESFVDKQDALIGLSVIKRDYNKSAWLLFQK